MLSGETRLYPILGDPIAFVKSPARMTAAFAARGHDGACVPMQAPAGALGPVVEGLSQAANVRGLLITMPHKQAMVEHCATLSDTARRLGAVSLARRNPDGSWHGEMLDGAAFVAALTAAGARLDGARVLQVGVGGAGSAIALALLQAGVGALTLSDIDAARRDDLLRRLADAGPVVGGPPDPSGCDIVVNATPLGLSPDDPPPVAPERLTAAMVVGDVIAGHGVTPLLAAARRLGCRTADGSAMVDAGVALMCAFLLGREREAAVSLSPPQ